MINSDRIACNPALLMYTSSDNSIHYVKQKIESTDKIFVILIGFSKNFHSQVTHYAENFLYPSCPSVCPSVL